METPAIVISGIVAGVGTLLLIAYAGGSRELAQQHETAAELAAHAQANAAEAKRIEMAGIEAGRKVDMYSAVGWEQRHGQDPQTLELRRLEAEDRAALAANRR